MKKITLLYILALTAGLQTVFAQSASLAEPGVAVFYPKDFDSIHTLPSLAVIKDLPKHDSLPAAWRVKPKFIQMDGKSSVHFEPEVRVE